MDIQRSYILAVDQSTSATKTMLFNHNAEILHRLQIPHQQLYPRVGFVEHDAMEIFNNTLEGIRNLITISGIPMAEIAGISLTNQRETVLLWDKFTGLPVANAAVWQCQRGVEFCNTLKQEGYEALIREKTGLLIDPYFSASKLWWLMNNRPGLKEMAKEGKLLMGTMDTWLLWKLTKGKVHATDYTNACRTMLFNIKKTCWDEELIALFGLHPSMFPEVKFSDVIFGYTHPSFTNNIPLPIAGLSGDSHAALFGQLCTSPGMGKATYGTGSSLMLNIGENPIDAPKGLVTSIGYAMNSKIYYAFEGNIHCTGDTLNWLKNDLQLISSIEESETLAASVETNNGVFLVPAFSGLGAPHWQNQARASISGMPRDTTRAHIARAALESIAYQVKDVVNAMVENGEIPLDELRVDGGPTRNKFLMQFQADILNRDVICSAIEEISALGATFMAGLALGVWKSLEEIACLQKPGRQHHPQMTTQRINHLYSAWTKAVERTKL